MRRLRHLPARVRLRTVTGRMIMDGGVECVRVACCIHDALL